MSTPPVSTPPPGASPTLDTSELRTHIPTDIRSTCAEYAPPAGDDLEIKLVGALRCELTGTDTPDKVWYFEYPNTTAMDAAFKPYTAGEFTKGECEAKQQKMDYTTTEKKKKLPGGVLYCYESDGESYFAWTHDFLHVVSFAADPGLSYPKMKAWWRAPAPTASRDRALSLSKGRGPA